MTILVLGSFVMLSPAVGRAQIVTNTWTGQGGDANASTAGNWSEGVPLVTHHILLDGTTNKDLTWDATAVHTVASWTQTEAYAGTVTVATIYGNVGFTNFAIAGDCIISNGAWTQTANPNVNYETNRLKASISGNLTIGPDAVIDVTGCGYQNGKGPGYSGSAGSYGGRGSMTRGSGPCYGSTVSPTNLGSGGSSSAGGGAILITVVGEAYHDGAIRANGAGTTYYTGSGGSVYLIAGALSGDGAVQAHGADAINYYAGGGGRVALVVTNAGADFAGFTGAVSAYGGISAHAWAHRGNAGTIYMQEGDDAPGNGELIVNNYGGTGARYYSENASLGSGEVATCEFRRMTFTNSGILDIGAGYTLTVSNTVLVGTNGNGIWLNGGTLLTDPDFIYSNIFIGISATGSTFNPASSMTIGSNAEFRTDQPHTMTCDLTIADGGKLTHTANNDTEAYKVDLTIDGSLTVESGGSVDVDRMGILNGIGPAGTGGGHGGRGGTGSLPYGSIVAPTNLGTGISINYPGGGAVRLTVSGTLSNDGVVSADGMTGSSGGSIWITAGTMTGTGPVHAASAAYAGGRIALVVTNAGADFSGITGLVSAYGKGAGTVYTRTAEQGPYDGTLIVDNNLISANGTEIGPYVTDAVVGNVLIRNNGYLVVEADESLTLSGVWSNSATYEGKDGSQIIFAGSASSTSTLYGCTTFMGLTSTNTTSKTLMFEAGKTNTIPVDGRLKLAGSATETNLLLRSTNEGTPWYLNVNALADQYVAYADVKDSDALQGTGMEVIGLNSVDQGGNQNWRFQQAAIGETNVWTGDSNTVWSAATNWSLARPPLVSDFILIPSSRPHYPALRNQRTVSGIEIQTGASLALVSNDLTVTGNAVVAGAIAASADETVTFQTNVTFAGGAYTSALSTIALAGTGDQSANFAGLTFHKITVQNSAGTVSFGAGFFADELRCEAASGTRNLQFQQGTTVALRGLVLLGSTASTNILLRSSTGGQKWNLTVSGYRSVRAVDVQDSDASSGLGIPAVSSVSRGGNTNWVFDSAYSAWQGTSSADFHLANNWDPVSVPGADARVLVDSVNPMTITGAVSLLDLTVGGGANSSTVTVNAALVVIESIAIWTNGTLALNRPCVVSNAVNVLAGGTLTHSANPAATELNKLDLTVAQDMAVDVDGCIDVTGKGNGQWSYGSSYGGRGHGDEPCFGSIVAPTNLGRAYSADSPGGGVIRLQVTGTFRHDGVIYANGMDGDYRVGSGGSIWLTANELTGTGALAANGGIYSGHSGAGGGRIALVVTAEGSDFSAFTGSVQARSSRAAGSPTATDCGAGTIYRQTAANGAGHGTVLVDNGGYTTTGPTDVPPASHFTPGEAKRAVFRLSNEAKLLVTNKYQVADIWMDTVNTELDLGGQILYVTSFEHELDGTVSNYGLIVWRNADGSLFVVR